MLAAKMIMTMIILMIKIRIMVIIIKKYQLFYFQDASGRWTMEEIPNSEKVFKADLVIIAAGFLGPEKTLAQQFGVKKVTLASLQSNTCLVVLLYD